LPNRLPPGTPPIAWLFGMVKYGAPAFANALVDIDNEVRGVKPGAWLVEQAKYADPVKTCAA
jgi:hypothetical protein